MIPSSQAPQPSSNGGGGIRTRDTPKGIPVFKTGAFNRSATPPVPGVRTVASYPRFVGNAWAVGELAAAVPRPHREPRRPRRRFVQTGAERRMAVSLSAARRRFFG